MGLRVVAAAAGVEVVEVAVFLADLVGGIVAGLGLVLLVEDLDREIAEKLLSLMPGWSSPSSSDKVQDVLREADDGDAAATAGLLKEVVPARDEILKFVLPEKYRVGRFGELAPEPGPLKNSFRMTLIRRPVSWPYSSSGKSQMTIFPSMRRVFGRECAFAAAEQAG